ncbi:F-box domain containing protein [Parasponia andersonii]|uniref:F-box domain containing protein n=1 Tax=Parasponia andersonii TaxID=3476 RepID=A0A2P5AAU4_PARAD|nr:F-box domain containing protein [Parasponia andersonii]
MANWSQLPADLLVEIAKRLESPIYLLRFRSVCSSWRSSVSPRLRNLLGRFPFLPNDGISSTSWGFDLTKRRILLMGSPQDPNPSAPDHWLVKIEESVTGTMLLFNPLSRFQIKPLPEDFPRVLDLSQFRVFELGQEYVLHYMHFGPIRNLLGDAVNLYMEKVVFKFLGSENESFVLFTIHVSGRLATYKSGDKRWTIIPDMPSPYDDVILFKDNFYAVDSTGRTVLVGLSSNVVLVANPVFGGDKKFLVESRGQLLMVDMYLSMSPPGEDPVNDELFEQFNGCLGERTVRFIVHELDREAKTWNVVKSLGDQVLFLGDGCTFSASASELSGCKSSIIFNDNFFYNGGEEDGVFRGRDIGVYDLGNGSIAPLADYPEYSKLFWPPPCWITSATSGAASTDSVKATQLFWPSKWQTNAWLDAYRGPQWCFVHVHDFRD